MGVNRKKTQKSLSLGRPPTARPPKAAFSRKTARTLINRHHHLEKRRQQAIRDGDEGSAAAAAAEISALGGLERYQQASLLGQSKDRGGDSSRVLLDWLKPSLSSKNKEIGTQIRMLEVGALSTSNACAASGYFETVHIDLNSQAPGILKQDFMERPLPSSDAERFDLISLSLVLNFVPDPAARGRFSRLEWKITGKLVYSLWRRDAAVSTPARSFPKKEINPGPKRNNFAVVLKGTKDA
ncbi:Uncharacterized protein SAPIO_CDS3005 [Scedosporium apiospermum]|uniref:25S rRNA adenine-N(1) methyltransferase n=1 Tax=Pseudallescheria apiosperma TaxID=563466 RepID=A0A084GC11_PSEDA|nr:Uncharacterized protein SAPIO_CDS3005 [Scedosporium apiospermum]KEZ44873.1 Uncharacterized protein SAPIO_CDS3005 [Scedosporium apiospermum]